VLVLIETFGLEEPLFSSFFLLALGLAEGSDPSLSLPSDAPRPLTFFEALSLDSDPDAVKEGEAEEEAEEAEAASSAAALRGVRILFFLSEREESPDALSLPKKLRRLLLFGSSSEEVAVEAPESFFDPFFLFLPSPLSSSDEMSFEEVERGIEDSEDDSPSPTSSQETTREGESSSAMTTTSLELKSFIFRSNSSQSDFQAPKRNL